MSQPAPPKPIRQTKTRCVESCCPLDRKLEVAMMPFIHRDVPFEMNDARSRKGIDAQVTRQPQLSFGRRPFTRPFPPLAVRPYAQARIVGFHEWRGLRVADP